ncbi:MAG TPA: glycosyl hydrolase family 18 protein [Clostridium sp.]|uniref:glycosyl hydrolase family 18 protein n=1 Tax=Clostridium sp. TaxID=1506 RepID=UPI002F956B4D
MEIYNVRSGDSIFSIAQKYVVSSQSIVNINGLTEPQKLVIGMNLVIPTQSLYDMQQSKTTIETLGYYTPPSYKDAISLIDNLGQSFTYLGIYYFHVIATGDIVEDIDIDILTISYEKKISFLPVVTNMSENNFSSELARTIISNPVVTNNFVNGILELLKKYDLQGINIDFENLYPVDRNLFTEFIRILSQALHKNNKILVLNIAPKWQDWPEKEWAGFFDYNALGPYIDIAAIMTYEWGWREGSPRPTAPINYIKQSLDYAIANNIPANKILMGMTLYGYDWNTSNGIKNIATTVTLSQVWDLARLHNGSIYFDVETKQPYMNYIDFNREYHVVWFEDALSHYWKYQLLKDFNLRGAFYWTINLPFPSTWYILSNMFNITK